MFLKARELLSENLTSWQDKCSDATNVPDSVMSMIEGLRTPVANTPQASPSLQRHSRVRTPTPTLRNEYSVQAGCVMNSYLHFSVPVQSNSDALIPAPPLPPQTSPLASMFNQESSRQDRESGEHHLTC